MTILLFDIEIQFLRAFLSRWYPFSNDQIRRYNNINWYELSLNPNLNWSDDLLEEYYYRWSWERLSRNRFLPLNKELIIKYNSKWERDILQNAIMGRFDRSFVSNDFNKDINRVDVIPNITNKGTYWIKEHGSAKTWSDISVNTDIEWTTAFIRENANKLIWGDTIVVNYDEIDFDFERYGSICSNPSVRIDSFFIYEFIDEISWFSLSLNEGSKWSIELIKEFEEYWIWNWDDYWLNDGEDFIIYNIPDSFSDDDFKDDLETCFLSANHALPWSEEFLTEFRGYIDWSLISRAYYIPWSITLLGKHFENFDKKHLINNYALWEKIFKIPVSENNKIVEAVFG